MQTRRGDVYLANLNPTIGSEQFGRSPVLVIQNNIGNTYSPTIIVAVIQYGAIKKNIPTQVEVVISESKGMKTSFVALEQIRTLDKSRILKKIGKIDASSMEKVNAAIKVSLDIRPQKTRLQKSCAAATGDYNH